MSTAPNAVSAIPLPHVQAAVQIFQDRIQPARLVQNNDDNASYFSSWFVSKRMDVRNLTAGAIADQLYEATQSDCAKPARDRQLKWAVPPKTLLRELEQAKNRPSNVLDSRAAGDFEQRARAGEKAVEQQKIQNAAKKRCQELVVQFAPTNHRRGVLDYSLRDEKQAEWRKAIGEAKDFVKLERAIADEQSKIYEKLERAAERI